MRTISHITQLWQLHSQGWGFQTAKLLEDIRNVPHCLLGKIPTYTSTKQALIFDSFKASLLDFLLQ